MKLQILSLMPLAGSAFVIPNFQVFGNADSTSQHEDVESNQRSSPLDLALENGQTGWCPHYQQAQLRKEHFLERVDISNARSNSVEHDATEAAPYIEHDAETIDFSSSSNSFEPFKHHDHSNLTIYQLISESKYTSKLAKLVSEDEALVKVLNGTKANYTLFAPTDKAFEKIPDCGDKPSKEFIRELLLLHISDDFYPAKRVLATHTIPSLHEEKHLGGRQRLVPKLTLKGLTINYFSRVVAVNIFGKNGVIHGVDHIIFFPPPTVPIIELTPSYFSTLALALEKTKLGKALKDLPHVGGTFFAPSNFAFAKLGGKANAFLFSKYGQKYLAALLKYHVVHNATVYSDAFYHDDAKLVTDDHSGKHYHLDLPTLLEDRSLPVDVVQWGPFININVNGYVKVSIQDGVARDGVIHVVPNVLIPPKKHDDDESVGFWDGETELTVEDLKERLGPFVTDSDEADNVDDNDAWTFLDSAPEHDDEEEPTFEIQNQDILSSWNVDL